MATPESTELLSLAVESVRRAATLVGEMRAAAVTSIETKSTPTDPVTEADRAAERLVVEGLAAARPGDLVLGEEGGFRPVGEKADPDAVRWLLDPIDGTVNFVYGIPAYGVSLAAEVDGTVVAGVVRNVVTGEEWTAVRGGGAWRDGKRLSGSGVTDLGRALIGTGFGYAAERRRRQAEVLVRLLPRIRDIRRIGSAALDLCAVAEGRLDAFYEQGLNAWDSAAGGLVAEEAGLLVTGLRGEPAGPGMTLVAPPSIHGELHDLLAG
ncbi:inositol monophosphatase family protein [Cryptosporangium phraense]|uniref:Inositol-1-monophosphatase n=1 Tax=Cryptosporangium phraense TaxID=2593070 RepID=A0A545AIY7_9ACTN|nr:inositol monophosphatase family protein [Cryptosporangium phraense]TQS41286.1 inositol monophosphatase [Cryptosporangium phraense]